jgi:hypothetical protein
MTDLQSIQGLPLEEALLAIPRHIWVVTEDVTPRKGADPQGVFRVLRYMQDEDSLLVTVCRFPRLGYTWSPKGGGDAVDS